MCDSDLADQPLTPDSDQIFTLKVPVVTLHNQHRTPKKSSFMPSKPSPMEEPEVLIKRTSSPQAIEAQDRMKRLIQTNQRSEEEAKLLYEKIQHFPFFETFNDRNSNSFFGDEAFIRLCQSARYEKHPAKKVIFKEGDPTNGKLYIIYSGEVSVVNQTSSAFLTQNQELQAPDDVKDGISDNMSTISMKEDLRLSRFSEKSNNASFLMVGRPSKMRIMDSEADISMSPAKSSRRHTRVAMDHHSVKQKSDPNDDGEETAKSDKRPRNLDVRFSTSGNMSRDSFRWNPNSAKEIKHKNSLFEPNEGGNRRGSWKILQHMMPTLAKFKAAVNGKKQESKLLSEVIREHGAVTSKLGVGEFFGERAVFEQSTRAATIVTNTECEFLVIYKRDFYFVSRNYDRKRTKLLDFIFNFTPDIENIHTFQMAEDLLSILKEKTYEKGSLIIEEGKPGNSFVIVFDGSCELVKTLRIDERPNQKDFFAPIEQLVRVRPVYTEELLVCNVERGAFLGEEVLFTESNTYSFSVRVTSAFATVFIVNKSTFHSGFTKLTQNHIKNMFMAKRKKHNNLMRYLLQTKFPALEVSPTGDTSPENSSNSDYKLITHPISLKAKDRTEAKRKARVGLFNALIEQSEDASILNQYVMTSPSEAGLACRLDSLPKSTKNVVDDKKARKSSYPILEDDIEIVEMNVNMTPKTLLSPKQKLLSSQPQTPSSQFSGTNRILSPKTRTVPLSSVKTKLQTRASEKDLRLDTFVDQPDQLIDYITSTKTMNMYTTGPSEIGSSKQDLDTNRVASPVKEVHPFTERSATKTIQLGRAERRLISEVDNNNKEGKVPMALMSDLFEFDKKAKKILEIQKSRIASKYHGPGSLTDNRMSPQIKTEHLIENIKEKFNGKVKTSPRGWSARSNSGPFLVINTSTLETPQSYRNPAKKLGTITTPITRKNSAKVGQFFADEINDRDDDIDEKDFGRTKETFATIPRTDRPWTSKPSKGDKALKSIYLMTDLALSKTKSMPSTKILKLKHQRNLKLKAKRQSENMETLPNREKVVIDFQVNGNVQTHAGQKMFTRKKQRPVSGINFTKEYA